MRREVLPTALLVAVALLHALLFYDFPFEDAYISFRYVEHLIDGQGLVYNPGEQVEGFTSFGWVMLLAGTRALGLPLPQTARVLSCGFGLALVALTARLAARVHASDRPFWLASGLLVAAHGTLAYYALTGMETTLFALLVLGAAAAAIRPGTRSALAAGALLGGAGLVRPEGAGYAVAIGLALFAGRESRRAALLSLAAFGALFVPYFLWRWHHFGWLLPNTYYAKASLSCALVVDGFAQLEEFLTLSAFWLAPPALALVLSDRQRRKHRFWRIATSVVGAAFANEVLVGGDSFAFYRFLLPAIPFGALALVEGARVAGKRLSRRGHAPSRLTTIGWIAFFAVALFSFGAAFVPRRTLSGDHGQSQHRRVLGVARINQDYFVVGDWLRRHFRPGTSVAVNAAGIVPYTSALRTIDMLGLNDVQIAHRPIVLGKTGAAGHEKHDAAYVLGRRPDLILPGLPVLSPERIGPDRLLQWFGHWFAYLPGDRELFENPAFAESYVGVSVPIDSRGYLTFFLRKDAERPRRRH